MNTFCWKWFKTQITIGQIEEAKKTLEEMRTTIPYRESVWLLLSSLHFQYGSVTDAIATLYEGLKLITQSAKLTYKLAAYCFLAERSEEAYDRLTDALLLDFNLHTLLFADAPKLEYNQAVLDVIDLYRSEND